MTLMAKWLYLLALAVWVGGAAFLRGAVAPMVLRTLGAEDAARLMSRLLVWYYRVGVVCAAVGMVCVGFLLADSAFSTWPAILSLALLAGAGVTDWWLWRAVCPQLNALRDRADEKDAEAGRERETLHQLIVRLNVAVWLCGLVLLFLMVCGHAV
jgi:uncharacterized membrane protein